MVKSKVPMNSYEEKGCQHQQQQEPHAGAPPPALTIAPPPVQRWSAHRCLMPVGTALPSPGRDACPPDLVTQGQRVGRDRTS